MSDRLIAINTFEVSLYNDGKISVRYEGRDGQIKVGNSYNVYELFDFMKRFFMETCESNINSQIQSVEEASKKYTEEISNLIRLKAKIPDLAGGR